jgi:hypothetical protein
VSEAHLQNNSSIPWAWADFDGMRLAMMVDLFWGYQFTQSEFHVLMVLYSVMVRDGVLIDHRVSQKGLAKRCRVSVPTIERAVAKFKRLGLIIVEQDAEGHDTAYMSVPWEELSNLVESRLGHSPGRGYD